MSHFIHRFHKVIIFMAVLLAVISTLAAWRLKLDLSLFSLLPSGRPEVQRFFDIAEEIGFQSLLISIVDVNKNLDTPAITEFMETLAERYARKPHDCQSGLPTRPPSRS